MKIAGIFNPTAATIRPMLAVSVYPGATEEIPRTAPEKVPIVPAARPLAESGGAVSLETAVWTVMATPGDRVRGLTSLSECDSLSMRTTISERNSEFSAGAGTRLRTVQSVLDDA